MRTLFLLPSLTFFPRPFGLGLDSGLGLHFFRPLHHPHRRDDRLEQLGRGVKRDYSIHMQKGNRLDLAIGDEPGEMGSKLPPVVFGPDVLRVKSVAGSDGLTCAVVDTATQSDQVKCWG